MAELSTLHNPLLDTNGFTDEILEAFSSLKELIMLDLWGNKLSGSIPVWIWQHQKFGILYVYDNGLIEELSCNITTVNLIKKDLSGNKLTGCIPEDFGTLKKLTIIIIYNNEFICPIPGSIDLIPNLQYIQLFDNMLSSEVPQELGKHSPLGNIEVYNKNLSSSPLQELCAHGKLFNIVVSNNSFSGELSVSIGNCLSLDKTLCSGNFDDWLHHRYREGAPAPLYMPRRPTIAIDAALGLNYIHQVCGQAIIHWDIKSDNILLDPKFHAKIADFGLTRMVVNLGESQHMSAICGTHRYMTLEYFQYNGKASKKTDIYSFGVVLLELTTGVVAKGIGGGESLGEWAWKVLQDAI
nr:leucine-rich repeat receptor-like kinase protein CLV1a [Aegilops tauschii subsp. strangulata]